MNSILSELKALYLNSIWANAAERLFEEEKFSLLNHLFVNLKRTTLKNQFQKHPVAETLNW